MEFMQKWYRKCISISEIPEVFQDWCQTNWGSEIPSLMFMLPKDLDQHPRRRVEVEGFCNKRVDLRLEWVSNFIDPQRKRVNARNLPQIVAEFLRIDDPQEKLILVDLGHNINWRERLRR